MEAGDIHRARQRRFRWLTISFLLALIAFGLTDVRRRARIDTADPDAHRTDLTIFTGAGAAFLADDTPYARANARGWKYAYPPLCALLLAPLATLHPQLQAVIWYAVSCLLVWRTWCEAVRISHRLGLDVRLHPDNRTAGRRLSWLAVAAVALPTLNCLQRGQVGVLYLSLLLWGFRLLLESATWRAAFAAGVVLALPGVIKVTPALPAVAAVGMFALASLSRRRGDCSLSPGGEFRAGCGLTTGGEGRGEGDCSSVLSRCDTSPQFSLSPWPTRRMATPLAEQREFGFTGPRRSAWSAATAAPLGLLCGVALFLFIVPAAILGWQANLRHLQTWTGTIATMAVAVDPGSSLETPYTVRNQSLSNAVYRFGNWFDHVALGGPDDRTIDTVPFNPNHQLVMDAPWVGRAVLAVRLLLLGLLVVAAWRVAIRHDMAGMAAVFGLACVASLLVSPLSRGHYFVMLLPGVLWVSGAALQNSRCIAIMTWLPLGLTWAHYLWLDQAGRVGVLGIGTTAWFVAGVVAVLGRHVAVGDDAKPQATLGVVQRAA